MNSSPEPQELPPELQGDLRALAGMKAPSELWDRVSLTAMGGEKAPEDLWERVAPLVVDSAPVPAEASSVPAGVLLSFPRLVASLAAVLALVVGIGLFLADGRTLPDPLVAGLHDPALRDQYRARVLAVEVEPGSLSGVGRNLAGFLGAPQSVEGNL
jgi:hypothetical protein